MSCAKIILIAILLAVGASSYVMAMDNTIIMTMFWAGGGAETDGYVLYLNADRMTINGDVITL